MSKIEITDAASREISRLLKSKENGTNFRIIVKGGGCSGFKYDFKFDKEVSENDEIFEKNGIKLIIDDLSLNLINGALLDFSESLTSSEFQLKNPNAAGSCGCGQSFSI